MGSLRTKLGRAVGDLLAVVEHDDVVGDLHHHAHVVLDEEDRDLVLAADEAEELVEFGRLARVEAGGRLVEAEEQRIGAHGAGDLQPSLGAIGQVGRRIVGAVDQVDLLEPVDAPSRSPSCGRRDSRRGRSRPPIVEARGRHQLVVLRDHQVLEHGHAAEQADVLEGARDPRMLGDLVVGHALEQVELPSTVVLPLAVDRGRRSETAPGVERHGDPPLGRLVEAGDAVEDGGLAGAVRADQRGDVAAADGEGKVVDRHQAAEAHGQMLDREDRVGLASALIRGPRPQLRAGDGLPLARGRTDGCRVEIRPRGRHTMISTIDRPTISMRYARSKSSRRRSKIGVSSRHDDAR